MIMHDLFKWLICGAIALLFIASHAEEAASDSAAGEKPVMDIGGMVTVDLYAPVEEVADPVLEVGTVELGANVYIDPELTATVVLLAEGDMAAISIDQAMATRTFGNLPLTVYFGQHYFSHGLLTTRLISDPALIDMVEMGGAGLTALVGLNDQLSLGAAFTVVPVLEERDYACVLNADLVPMENSLIRLSGLASENLGDADLAVNVALGPLLLDVESFYRFRSPGEEAKAAGYYAGAAFEAPFSLTPAVRYDAVSWDGFRDFDVRLAAGVTRSFSHGIFAALELANVSPFEGDAYQEIAVQVGLQSTIELPGFQRKTLTRE